MNHEMQLAKKEFQEFDIKFIAPRKYKIQSSLSEYMKIELVNYIAMFMLGRVT